MKDPPPKSTGISNLKFTKNKSTGNITKGIATVCLFPVSRFHP